MRAIQKVSPQLGVTIQDVPAPDKPGDEEVLIEVAAAGICGSDVHAYEWTSGYEWVEPFLPITLGHEFAGTIASVGCKVRSVQTGDRVAVWPAVSCGSCRSCISNREDVCERKRTIGFTLPGGFARYVLVPEKNCFKLEPDTDLALGALAEPLCVGASAVRTGEVRPGQSVLVLGAGTIGQAIIAMAKRAGASQIVVAGMNDTTRLSIAGKLGATHTIDLAETSLGEFLSVHEFNGFDRVFEATGCASSVVDGLGVLARGGILVAAGIHSEPASLNLTTFVRSKHQLRAAHGSTRADWISVTRLLQEHASEFRSMITHDLPLESGLEAFALTRAREANKVILRPNPTTSQIVT